METRKIIELIQMEGLENEFVRILGEIMNGELNRDDDESYTEGFWDFTYNLGFDCDTKENEKEFESVYNKLWEIAESIKEEE